MLPNWVWSLLLLALLIALTLVAWRFNRRVFLIAALHNGIWAGAVVLVGTNLIDYVESSTPAWLTLALGMVAFNIGVQMVRWTPKLAFVDWMLKGSHRPPLRTTSIVTRRAFYAAAAIYAFAFGWYLINIQARFGLATLLLDPAAIRSAPGDSYLETVPLPVRVLLYLGPLLFAILGFKDSFERPLSPWIRFVGAIGLAASMLALLQRTNLFMGILLLMALLLTQPRKSQASSSTRTAESRKRNLKLAGALSLAAILAFVAFQGLAAALGKQGTQAASTGAVSDVLQRSGLQSPFFYYTAGTVAFLQLVDSRNEQWPPEPEEGTTLVGDYNPQTWGSATFAPIVKVIPGARSWAGISPFIETPAWTNVYTWLEPFYRDFRAAGVFVGALVVGFATAYLYSRRDLSSRAFWLQAALVSVIPLATFVPKLNNTLFLAELLFIIFLTSGLLRLGLGGSRGSAIFAKETDSR